VKGQGPKNEPTFIVEYPRTGSSSPRSAWSPTPLIRVWIDDPTGGREGYPCGEGLGKAARTASSGSSGRPPTTSR